LGNLHLNDAGYVDCDEIKILYPKEWERATRNRQIEYLEAVKDTCHNWKNGRKEKMAQDDRVKLVNTIRSLEAENHMLRQQIIELEMKLHPCSGLE
jgi:hypothetical protein